MIDFNGSPLEVLIPGDRTHHFVLPLDRSALPAKTLKAIEQLETARDDESAVRSKKANDRAALDKAQDAVKDALNGVYDTAAATSRGSAEHHREQAAYATARFGRAISEAQGALQAVVDHARQAENPGGVGFPSDPRLTSPTVQQLRVITEALANLPAIPEVA
ncbi:hypothetical protein ABT300_05605 [Streptomyces sp. NPDC001027]|uniref:hypothetical protein n=1 Tax=Streptomyces sp. NPDC001027 TaxID=3154771 RepID=UPI003322AADF